VSSLDVTYNQKLSCYEASSFGADRESFPLQASMGLSVHNDNHYDDNSIGDDSHLITAAIYFIIKLASLHSYYS
jgi:hypothetical protein